jgi:hypothetical protein
VNELPFGFGNAFSPYAPDREPRLVKRVPLAGGDAGVRQTIDEMRRMVRESRADPFWKDLSIRLVPVGRAVLGLHAYRQLLVGLRHVFRYARDAAGTEQLFRPEVHAARIRTVGATWGDCDDAAIVAGCIVYAANLGPLRFKTIANGKRGREMNHVFAEVHVDGAWRTLDFLSPPQTVVREAVWAV